MKNKQLKIVLLLIYKYYKNVFKSNNQCYKAGKI